MDKLFDLPLIEARKFCAIDHRVQLMQSVEGGIDRGERIIRSEEQLMPNAVFLDEHQAVKELPRPIVQRADVGIDVRMLADDGDALAFVGMAEMSQDEFYLRKSGGDIVQPSRQCELQRGLCDERRPRVQ